MAYFLSCANLTSPTCTLGDYVIDWALNSVGGDIIFVSANQGNEEEGIDAYHPLVDEITPSGTLYPIIRYVYISGVKNTSVYEEDALYSPDLLTCLSPVIIDPIDCAASNFTPTDSLPYDFRILRDVGEGSKDRSFHFEIGASTQYFAWGFNADNISDQIQIYYCTTIDSVGILIDNLVTGTDAIQDITPVSYPTNPIIIDASSSSEVVKYVSDLTSFSYSSGDYIRIDILGNYYNPSLDATKWVIYMRCLESLDSIPDMTPIFTKTGDVTVTYNSGTCSYLFDYPVVDGHIEYTGYQDSDFKKYFFVKALGAGINTTGDINTVTHSWNETVSGSGSANFGCAAYAGTVTTDKVGSVVTWTFTNPTDYTLFKNRYDTLLAGIGYTNSISADPDIDPEYYGDFQIMVMTNPDACDQPNDFIRLTIHWSSIWTFDPIDEETISVDLNVPTNTLNEYGDCNNWNETVTSEISNMTTSLGLSDFSYPQIKSFSPFSFHFTFYSSAKLYPSPIDSDNRYQIYIPNVMLNGIYTPTNALGYVSNHVSNFWYVFAGKDTSEFLSYATHEERLASWCFSRSRYFTTLDQTDLATFDVIDCSPSTTTTTTTESSTTTTTTTSE